MEDKFSIISNNKIRLSFLAFFLDNMDFKINYGTNYFPEKIYKGVKYEAGEYESMVVKIGSGSGDNYWCVLFPPLCLMEAEETDDVEYKFFIKEIIDKIF